jgi:hypothetical protein
MLAVQGVVSFADPLALYDADGHCYKQSHVGVAYQASNATYCGRSKPHWRYITRSGTLVSGRALAKLRTDDVGARYAYEQLRAAGAPPINPGESGADYVRRALSDRSLFTRQHHKGLHAYVFPVGDRNERAAMRQRLGQGLPYPRLQRRATHAAQSAP